MRKKTISKILELFTGFRKDLEIKPPVNVMYDEIRMMRFKIRPLQGDITLLNLKNERLIETLWQLGKLDDFFQREFKRLSNPQQEIFFNFFEELHSKLQHDLNYVSLRAGRVSPPIPSVFEMEITKERKETKKFN